MSGSPAHEIGIVDYPGAQVARILGPNRFLRHRLNDGKERFERAELAIKNAQREPATR